MTPHEFINIWTNTGESLSPLTPSRLSRFKLSTSTVDFLTIVGLPEFGLSNLSFANDTDDIIYGVNKLIEQYEFGDEKSSFENYVVIGSCRDGDPIAIDTNLDDQIVELDHEDLFSAKYFNRSIQSLVNFFILYREFEKDVLIDKDPEDKFRYYNFTDYQFDNLKMTMYAADSRAITENGFWKDKLEIMLSLRTKYYGTS